MLVVGGGNGSRCVSMDNSCKNEARGGVWWWLDSTRASGEAWVVLSAVSRMSDNVESGAGGGAC